MLNTLNLNNYIQYNKFSQLILGLIDKKTYVLKKLHILRFRLILVAKNAFLSYNIGNLWITGF